MGGKITLVLLVVAMGAYWFGSVMYDIGFDAAMRLVEIDRARAHPKDPCDIWHMTTTPCR